MVRFVVLPLAIALAGCQCGTGAQTNVFVCRTNSECVSGFTCDLVSRTCVSTSGSGGGGGGGGTGVGGGGDDGGTGGGGVGGGAGGAGGGGGGVGGGGGAGGGAGGGGGATGGGSGGAGGGGKGGGGGGSGGGGAGGGGAAAAPDRLAITSPLQTIYTQACSAAVAFETRTDAGVPAPVAVLTAVSPSSAPVGLNFFSDSSCAMAATLVPIAGGTSTGNVWFKTPTAGNYTLGVTALGLQPASQLAKVVALPTSLTFTATPPNPIVASNCFPATVATRIGASNAPVIADTLVTLAEMPVDGTRYFTDAACTTRVSSVTILAGQSTASFFIKAITGATVTVTANSTFGSAMLQFTITGAVRRGTCLFPGNSNGSLDCFITPVQTSLAHTALIFQATSASEDPDYNEISCDLANTTRIRCRRGANGLAGQAPATIAWQTLELPVGLRVERPNLNCFVPQVTATIASVNPASSFVLKSSSQSGGNFGADDLGVAYLAAATSVTYDVITCNNSELLVQAVELTGLTVTRDNADAGILLGNLTGPESGLPAAGSNRVVLAQPRSAVLAAPVCSRLVRAEAPTATTLGFSRGAGIADGGCAPVDLQVAWERIDFGSRAGVQTFTTTLPAMGLTQDVVINAVDLTRTLVFSSAQTESGQGAGESADNAATQFTGEGLARFELLNATTVRVTREHANAAATFTFYVVQIEP